MDLGRRPSGPPNCICRSHGQGTCCPDPATLPLPWKSRRSIAIAAAARIMRLEEHDQGSPFFLSDIAVLLLMIQTHGSTSLIRALCGESDDESVAARARSLKDRRAGRPANRKPEARCEHPSHLLVSSAEAIDRPAIAPNLALATSSPARTASLFLPFVYDAPLRPSPRRRDGQVRGSRTVPVGLTPDWHPKKRGELFMQEPLFWPCACES